MRDLTLAFISTLTGSPDTILDWRAIHDKDKSIDPRNFRGTFADLEEVLRKYNQSGFGIFANVNELDGKGRELPNVHAIRTHMVDLDDVRVSAMQYSVATSLDNTFPPHFAVQSSENKYHLYWLVEPYRSNDFYALHQRKLAEVYSGDKTIHDATRVMRVPGFTHNKTDIPQMVSCWETGRHPRYTWEQVQNALLDVHLLSITSGRFPLGTKELEAPSLNWLQYALHHVDPNDLSYSEWMSFSAAVKQSGWNLTTEGNLFNIWSDWCARYANNKPAENQTVWNSHRETQLGWKSITYRVPQVRAALLLGCKEAPTPKQASNSTPVEITTPAVENVVTPTPTTQSTRDNMPEILDAEDCKVWFDGCVLIEGMGMIFTPDGRYMKSDRFSAKYGGRMFIITSTGKTTDDPWKAALRSTVWTIPHVDHIRFLPNLAPREVIHDELNRPGLNVYIPPFVKSRKGDVSIFLNHMEKVIPDEADRKMFMDYFAHSIKFPGVKIPYAPLLQSVEGVGKSAFFEIASHALGGMYIYRPKAQELVKSGLKFNVWMRNKILIMVDEIKIDERRELIEILKPMITDARVEIEGKGADQDMEDNVANWLFFSNHKDAIPISKNGRRYAVFYSPLQTEADLKDAGMDKQYFDRFWKWLRHEEGLEKVTHYLKNYSIKVGDLPVRAPKTSSHEEALRITRSPIETIITESVEDAVTGFRGGFISLEAATNACRNAGVRNVTPRLVEGVLEYMGYYLIGKTTTIIMQENANQKSKIYSKDGKKNPEQYAAAQGYCV